MKNKRPFWTVRCDLDPNRSHNIEVVFLHFRLVYLQDAQKQADSPYCEVSMKPFYQDKASAILTERVYPVYYDRAGLDNDFGCIAQRNVGQDKANGGTWYGLRLESGHLTEANCKAIMKLCNLASPQAAIDALKAKHAVYCSAASEWIPSTMPEYLKETE